MKKRGLGSGFGGLINVAADATQIREVPIVAVKPNPHQPRVAFEPTALEELAQSIREHGILQPLIVTRLDDGNYQLIAGERRLRAAQLAGLSTVPVVIKDVSEQQQLELALIENVQRADLDPIEEARAYAMLEDQFGLTHGQIAQRVGKSRSTISETLALLKLPPEVQAMVSAGQLTPGHASVLLTLRDPRREVAVAREIAARRLSVRRAEEYIAALNGAGKELARTAERRRSGTPATEEDEAIVKALEEHLYGMRVTLTRTGQGGRLTIYFDNEEMLQGLYERIVGS